MRCGRDVDRGNGRGRHSIRIRQASDQVPPHPSKLPPCCHSPASTGSRFANPGRLATTTGLHGSLQRLQDLQAPSSLTQGSRRSSSFRPHHPGHPERAGSIPVPELPGTVGRAQRNRCLARTGWIGAQNCTLAICNRRQGVPLPPANACGLKDGLQWGDGVLPNARLNDMGGQWSRTAGLRVPVPRSALPVRLCGRALGRTGSRRPAPSTGVVALLVPAWRWSGCSIPLTGKSPLTCRAEASCRRWIAGEGAERSRRVLMRRAHPGGNRCRGTLRCGAASHIRPPDFMTRIQHPWIDGPARDGHAFPFARLLAGSLAHRSSRIAESAAHSECGCRHMGDHPGMPFLRSSRGNARIGRVLPTGSQGRIGRKPGIRDLRQWSRVSPYSGDRFCWRTGDCVDRVAGRLVSGGPSYASGDDSRSREFDQGTAARPFGRRSHPENDTSDLGPTECARSGRIVRTRVNSRIGPSAPGIAGICAREAWNDPFS